MIEPWYVELCALEFPDQKVNRSIPLGNGIIYCTTSRGYLGNWSASDHCGSFADRCLSILSSRNVDFICDHCAQAVECQPSIALGPERQLMFYGAWQSYFDEFIYPRINPVFPFDDAESGGEDYLGF